MGAAPAYGDGPDDMPTPRQQKEQPISNFLWNASFGYVDIYDEVDEIRAEAVGDDGELNTFGEAWDYSIAYIDVLGGGIVDGITDAILDAINGVIFSFMVVGGATYRLMGHLVASLLNISIKSREAGSIQNLFIDPAYAPPLRVYASGYFGDSNIVYTRAMRAIWYYGSAPTLRPDVLPAWGFFNDGTIATAIEDHAAHFAPYEQFVRSSS